ncbi:MAG: DNA topoisomerase VI subunit B [Planctomycetota bacterium]
MAAKKRKKTRRKSSPKGDPRSKSEATSKSADTAKSEASAKSSSSPSGAAERMAKKQREISVSEFFTKNRHLLGFDSKRKALLTAVKEAVDNSLDACEEARILPDLFLSITLMKGKADVYTVVVEDNGPGIVKAQVPNIFGKLLYGSKFHRLRQSRGQQGIGISAAGMYGQLTTGNPVRVKSRTSKRATPNEFTIRIDTAKNKPVCTEKACDWEGKGHGTRVEIDLEGEHRRGQRSVEAFLKLVAVANPHVQITYIDPDGNETKYERATKDLPKETDEIKPHPHGVELGILQKMLESTGAKWLSSFLQQDFSRVGPKVAKGICETAKLNPHAQPKRIAKVEVDQLKQAIDKTKIMAPPTSCIAPIGDGLLLKGLKKEVEADFYVAKTRPPVVYRGHPFLIEVGLAYGRPGDTLELLESGKIVESEKRKRRKRSPDEGLMGFADEPAQLIRYANRVPLLYEQSACAMTKAVIQTNWRGYGMSQSRGALPIGPLVIMVHIASVWVPFTSEAKEAIASYPEIIKELKLCLQECGRKLGTHIRKGKKLESEYKKRSFIEMYIPHIGQALRDILDLTDRQTTTTVSRLTNVLEKSRKL